MSEKQTTFFTVNCAENFESPNQWRQWCSCLRSECCSALAAGPLLFPDQPRACGPIILSEPLIGKTRIEHCDNNQNPKQKTEKTRKRTSSPRIIARVIKLGAVVAKFAMSRKKAIPKSGFGRLGQCYNGLFQVVFKPI
jgi:hypothetical protein